MVIEGKYIYCIVKENEDKSLGYIGINNREVNLLHYNGMAAAVSSSPTVNFDRLDRKELTRQVAFHQKVNEQLMKDYDVVPMAFGIIAPSAMDVIRLLEKAYLQFEIAFKKIERKAEFVAQIFWDEKKFLAGFANSNQEIKSLKEEINAKGSIMNIGAKLKLGKIIFDILENKRKNFLEEIKMLKKYCSDYKEEKLTDETMISNISFLINKSDEPVFDKKIQELGEKYKDELSLKYVGPMPAYSFVNINFNLGNFELINEARKLLRLDIEATLDEIKKAYRALAHQYHPDKFQNEQKEKEIAQNQMKRISQSYYILEHYCQSHYEFMGKIEGLKYSFREKDVKDSVMLKNK